MTYSIAVAKVEPGPRERMIVSTALLVRERGARATSLDAVLEHSGAPRGSVYHHFPGGREQLLREATDYAGDYVARRLERDTGDGPLAAIDALFDEYRASLVASDFRAGCPVVAVAVETAEDGPDLRDAALAAFERWRRALVRRFEASGIEAARADELGMLVIAAFEGGLILSRTYRDLAPLESVRRELRQRLDAELAQSGGGT
jgi:AcrR family transcriptional regulator